MRCAVVLLELVGRDAVRGGALLAPARVPDPRALQHGVGVDGVDADAGRAALLGQAAREVQLGGLGASSRRRRSCPATSAFLDATKTIDAADALRPQHAERLARDQEVAGRRGSTGCGSTRPASSPRSARSTRCRRWRRRCRRRRTRRPPRRTRRARRPREVTSPRDREPARRRAPRPRPPAPSPSMSKATTHAPASRQRVDDRAPDPAGGAGDERDLALQLARRRRQRQLVQLERPVLDREALGRVERDELAERARRRPSPRSRGGRGRARDAAAFGRGAGRHQPDVLDQHDARVGVAGSVAVVAVALDVRRGSPRGRRRRRRRRARRASRPSRSRGSYGDPQRHAAWCGRGGPGTRRRPAVSRGGLGRVDELEHRRATVSTMQDLRALARDRAAQRRQHARAAVSAGVGVEPARLRARAAERVPRRAPCG